MSRLQREARLNELWGAAVINLFTVSVNRWAIMRRKRLFELDGASYTLDELAALSGVCRATIKDRIYRRRWSINDCVTLRAHQPTAYHAANPDGDSYVIRQVNGTKKPEHVLLAEAAIGKPLPSGAEVHHVNYKKRDNRPENLVVCPDRSYHQLIHRRTRAYDACGNASWKKCAYCKKHDDPSNLHIIKNGISDFVTHKKCQSEYNARYYANKNTAVNT